MVRAGADGSWVPRREGGSAGPWSATAAAGGAGGGAAAVARSGSARAEGERTRRGEGGGAWRADAVAMNGEERNARSAGRSGHAAVATAMLLRDDEEVARSAAAGWKPCNAGPGRRLAARPSEQGAALGGSRGAGRLRQRQRRMRPASCAAAAAREGVRGARCLAQRPRRGGNVQPRRGIASTLHVKPTGWAVETCDRKNTFAPKAQLSCVARTKVIRSGALPACENRARGNARSHGAAGHDSFRCGLRRSHRRHTRELRGRAET